MASPAIATGQGRRWIVRAHRAQTVCSGGLGRFVIGSANLSMVCPTKPSTAGSSVTAAAITSSTASAAPIESPRMNERPIRNRPNNEITTVPPANSTARPLVSIACTTACSGSSAFVQRLAIARADEQRVVDPDADTDHRRDLRRERRNVGEPGEQRDDGETDADAEQRGHDREAHREHRTERDQQDEHRGEDADRLARRVGSGR